MTEELIALLGGREIGRVHQEAKARLTFTYDRAWRAADEAYPLSLSMPLAAAEHGPGVVEPFLWGLLPDNERVLDRWRGAVRPARACRRGAEWRSRQGRLA